MRHSSHLHLHFHTHHRAARYDVDMTKGSITKHLINFALPLMVGNLFQQLYNMVDTWVVGNYVSNEAFSAVGTVTPIINTLIGFFLGLSSGAGVVISQYYGAGREDKVRQAVHTSLVLTLLMGAVFTAAGIAMTPLMLRLMKTPAEVAPEQTTYLTIYFAGVMGLLLYNMGSGILRAVGDSRRPFYFLLVSAVLNTGLDLLFVLKFGMGVEGVAYATIIAQAVSAALQMAITAFSNVFVQGYINYFGPDCMSGWTAYTKVDQLVILPVQSIAMAGTTFVGQNLGVGDTARAKKGVRTALYLSFAVTAVLLVPVLLLAPDLTAFFNSKAEVVSYGALLLRLLSPFYFFFCINQIYSAALRGAGNSQVPMWIMLGSFVVFRQIYLYIVANYVSNEIIPIAMSYPAGWFVCSVATLIYYRFCKFDSHRLVEDV